MRQSPKEKLYDKAKKMIDLIYDEVCDTGDKTLDTVFVNQKNHLRYKLTIGVEVVNPNKLTEANDDTPTEENTETPTEENNGETQNNTQEETPNSDVQTPGAETND